MIAILKELGIKEADITESNKHFQHKDKRSTFHTAEVYQYNEHLDQTQSARVREAIINQAPSPRF